MKIVLTVAGFEGMEILESMSGVPGKAAGVALPTQGVTKRLPKGFVLFKQGTDANSVFLLNSGVVRLAIDGAGESATKLLEKGDIAGEESLVPMSYQSTAMVVSEVAEVEEFSAASVRDSVASNPIASALLHKVVGLWSDRMVQSGSNSLDRLIQALLELAKYEGQDVAGGVQIKRRLTHDLLGSRIGAARETVTIQLGKLREAGAVKQGEGKYLVVVPDRLRELLAQRNDDKPASAKRTS